MPQPAQHAAGEQQLQSKRHHPRDHVEGPEEHGQLFRVGNRGFGDGLELPGLDGGRQRGEQDHGGNRLQVARAGDHLQGGQYASPAFVTGRAVPVHLRRPNAPDKDDEPGADHLGERGQQQHGLGAVAAHGHARHQATDDPAKDGAAAHQPERPLGLPGGQDEVGQRPDLGRDQHREHADPDVDQEEQGRALASRERGPPPEPQGRHAKPQEAGHLEVPQVEPLAGPDVDRGHHAHDQRDGDVHIGQVDRFVALQEQGVPRRLAGHRARHGQEQVGKQGQRAPKLAGVHTKEPLQVQHHSRGAGRWEFTLG